MAKYFQHISMDNEFATIAGKAIVLNDLPSTTAEDKEAINRLLLTTYEKEDVLSVVPSCECGNLTKGYNMGRTCPICEEEVNLPIESNVSSKVWIRHPCPDVPFMNPMIFIRLYSMFGATKSIESSFTALDWLCSNSGIKVSPKATIKTKSIIEYFERAGWVRGIGYLQRNYDKFIELVKGCSLLAKRDQIVELLEVNRGKVFCKHLPIINNLLLVLEKTGKVSFAALPISGVVEASKIITGIKQIEETTGRAISPAVLERKSYSIIKNLAGYYFMTLQKDFNGKRAWLRGQLYSGKSHFCGRGVITSRSGPHNYDGIELPWSMAVELYKVQLLGKLLKLGMKERDIHEFIERNVQKVEFDEERQLIHKLLMDYITSDKQMYDSRALASGCLIHRNPTLTKNAGVAVYVEVIKTNVYDRTISCSPLILAGNGGDYDGDENNIIAATGLDMAELFKIQEVHYGIHSLINFRKFNKNISLPDVTMSVLSCYLNG